VLLLLPITSALRGTPLHTLPDLLHQGGCCFVGLTPACGADCSGAPLLPVAYVVVNICFNIAVVNLLRTVGARGWRRPWPCFGRMTCPIGLWAGAGGREGTSGKIALGCSQAEYVARMAEVLLELALAMLDRLWQGRQVAAAGWC
jgi:hypothetical protein